MTAQLWTPDDLGDALVEYFDFRGSEGRTVIGLKGTLLSQSAPDLTLYFPERSTEEEMAADSSLFDFACTLLLRRRSIKNRSRRPTQILGSAGEKQ